MVIRVFIGGRWSVDLIADGGPQLFCRNESDGHPFGFSSCHWHLDSFEVGQIKPSRRREDSAASQWVFSWMVIRLIHGG